MPWAPQLANELWNGTKSTAPWRGIANCGVTWPVPAIWCNEPGHSARRNFGRSQPNADIFA